MLTRHFERTDQTLIRDAMQVLSSATLQWYQHTLGGHAQRTARLAEAVAHQLQQPEEHITLIRLAALLHDVGKIAVPTAVLNKPGPLTEQEWVLMRRHPEIGAQLLMQAGGIWAQLAPFVLAHHEHWNGGGYPYGLVGESIPLGARILSVVDSYDAMTEHRVYRASRSRVEAQLELQRGAGTRYDPLVVDALPPGVRRQVATRCFYRRGNDDVHGLC